MSNCVHLQFTCFPRSAVGLEPILSQLCTKKARREGKNVMTAAVCGGNKKKASRAQKALIAMMGAYTMHCSVQTVLCVFANAHVVFARRFGECRRVRKLRGCG